MTWTLDDLDPDKWLAAGNDLTDFPFPPDTQDERAAMLAALDKRPDLKMRIGRWMQKVSELGPGDEQIRFVLGEEKLRTIWAETAALS